MIVMSETLRLTIRYEEGEEGWIVASIPQVPGAPSRESLARASRSS